MQGRALVPDWACWHVVMMVLLVQAVALVESSLRMELAPRHPQAAPLELPVVSVYRSQTRDVAVCWGHS